MMQRLRMHPDLGGDHEEAAIINEAYAVLMNPDARARYDANLAVRRQRVDSRARTAGSHDEGAKSSSANKDDTHEGSHCMFCHAVCRTSDLTEPDDLCMRCGSALFPAKRKRFEAGGQRAIERVSKRISARYWTRWPQSVSQIGHMEDLSPSGMQLRTDEALTRGQIIKIEAGVLDAIACVVDSQKVDSDGPDRWRIGLMFKTLRIHRSRGTFVSINA